MQEFSQKSFRVLIVDDTSDIHQAYRKILSWGPVRKTALQDLETALFASEQTSGEELQPILPNLRLDSAFQGAQAVEMVTQALKENDPYQLIFMDVRMPPGMDGIKTTQEIWQIQPDVNVVICSAYADYSIDSIIRKLNISDKMLFLAKPFPAAVMKQTAIMMLRKWDLDHQLQTYTKDLETLVAERTAQLVQSSKMAALGEMAGGIAHEINNPLAVIRMSIEQMMERLENQNISHDLISNGQLVMRTVDRISKIISGLRAFSREEGSAPLQPTSIQGIIHSTLQLCHEKFRNHDIKVESDELDLKIECRPTEISQVLLNLLSNAFDAIQTLPEKWIKIGVQDRGASIVLTVMDSGTGLRQEIREKIMQPFFTTKEVGKGTGLGLSISKGIVENHRGRFYLDESSKNTCFVVELPKTQQPSRKSK